MRIGGILHNSLIDFPGKPAVVVFTQGCDWACPYCHNPQLIGNGVGRPLIEAKEVFLRLQRRPEEARNLVITGGEPTLQKGLLLFLEKAADCRISVKLDTNGSRPKILKEILDRELVDYVAMDVKGPLTTYSRYSGKSGLSDTVGRSIETLKTRNVDYEFRTTVVPLLHEVSDFNRIGKRLEGGRKLILQAFRGEQTYSQSLRQGPEPDDTFMANCAQVAGKWLPVLIR